MKQRLFIIALVLLGFSASAMAQLSIGLKAGANLASQTAQELNGEMINKDNLKSRITFHAGGFVEYDFSSHCGIEADVLYSMQGSVEDIANMSFDDIIDPNVRQKTTSHYINIPLTFKYYPVGGFYIEAGPQIGILLNSNFSIERSSFDTLKKDFEGTHIADYAVVGGLGYRFGGKFGIGARYVMGLNGTLKNIKGVKNRCIQASLSYAF